MAWLFTHAAPILISDLLPFRLSVVKYQPSVLLVNSKLRCALLGNRPFCPRLDWGCYWCSQSCGYKNGLCLLRRNWGGFLVMSIYRSLLVRAGGIELYVHFYVWAVLFGVALVLQERRVLVFVVHHLSTKERHQLLSNGKSLGARRRSQNLTCKFCDLYGL